MIAMIIIETQFWSVTLVNCDGHFDRITIISNTYTMKMAETFSPRRNTTGYCDGIATILAMIIQFKY
jgi:hypothetical protein